MRKGKRENLIAANELTEDQLRKMASNGGKKSAEVRRRKKTMREALEMLMYKTELPEQTKQMLKAEGISKEDFNHQMVITRSLIAKAESGDVQAYNAICAMIGEKPAEKMEMSGGMSGEIKIVHIMKSEDDANFPSSEDKVDAER
jgi:ribosome-binding protein aMBF1 (putative translation factor)